MKKSNTSIFLVGAILFLIAYLIGVIGSVLNNIAFAVIAHQSFAQFTLNSINIWSALSAIVYILILVFAFIKKPQFSIIPFGIFALSNLVFGLGSSISNIITSIANGYFSGAYLLSTFGAIFINVFSILIFALLAIISIDCFGKMSKPTLTRFWFIPAILFAFVVIVEIVIGLTSGLGWINMIEYNPAYLVFGLSTLVGFLSVGVKAAAIFMLGKGLFNYAKKIYADKKEQQEPLFDTDLIDNINN